MTGIYNKNMYLQFKNSINYRIYSILDENSVCNKDIFYRFLTYILKN